MGMLRKIAAKINGNFILRNITYAVCGLIVFAFIMTILLNVLTRHGQIREVPDITLMSLEEAEDAVRSSRLTLEVTDSMYLPSITPGAIIEQLPAAGAKVKSGRRVLLTVNATTQKRGKIPFVEGYSLRQAANILTDAGFEVKELVYVDDIATNNVLSQSYNGRTVGANSNIDAEIGEGVQLTVGFSQDAAHPIVPSLSGFTMREAKARIWEAGFNIGKVVQDDDVTPFNMNDARVYRQTPASGATGAFGESVTIYITTDQTKFKKKK